MLGLTKVMENDEVLAFKSGTSTLFVYRSPYAGTNKATAVTFVAEEIDDPVPELDFARPVREPPSSKISAVGYLLRVACLARCVAIRFFCSSISFRSRSIAFETRAKSCS